MEQQFVNKFDITLELYKEWGKKPLGSTAIKERGRFIKGNIFRLAFAVLLIIFGVLTKSFDAFLVCSLFGILALCYSLFRLFITPNRVLKKRYDAILKTLPDNQWIRTITFSDKIVIEDGKLVTQFEYSEVQRVTEDDNYFYLYIDADMVFRVRKDSFIESSPDDFREFINNNITNKTEPIETKDEDLDL